MQQQRLVVLISVLAVMLLASSPVTANSIIPYTLEFEVDGLDLDSGVIFPVDTEPAESGSPASQIDLVMASNSERVVHAVVFHNRMNGVEIAFLDGVAFNLVDSGDLAELSFTTAVIDMPFETEDSVVLRVDTGAHFLLGNPIEDANGVTFDTQLLEQSTAGLLRPESGSYLARREVPKAVRPEPARPQQPPVATDTRVYDFAQVPERPGVFETRNAVQGIRAEFDGADTRVYPLEGDPWEWGLTLVDYGHPETLSPIPAGELVAEGNRLENRRGDFVEWYVNDHRGLEQGFTLMSEPPGDPSEPLVLRLSASGTLTTVADRDPSSLRLVNDAGETILRYGGLVAWDASGRHLSARLVSSAKLLAIEVDDADAQYPVTIDPLVFTEDVKLLATEPGDLFGQSVALSGETLIVGVTGEDIAGVATNTGAAFVFDRIEGEWSYEERLIADDAANGDNFGGAVDIDGEVMVAGASGDDIDAVSNAGSGYVFERTGSTWNQVSKLTANDGAGNDKLGHSVAISGGLIVMGSPFDDHSGLTNAGAAYVFRQFLGYWVQSAKLTAYDADSGDRFGQSVDISNFTVVVGADVDTHEHGNSSGSAYVYLRNGIFNWNHEAKLTADDASFGESFGFAVSVEEDTAVVGARSAGHAGDDRTGAVYVYTRENTTWTQQAKLLHSDPESNDKMGTDVAISGGQIFAGIPYADPGGWTGAGEVHVFVQGESGWTEKARLTASDPTQHNSFGDRLAADAGTVAVGLPNHYFQGIQNWGAVYLFELDLPVCGDTIVGAGEECDDGNTTDGDGCKFDCVLPHCGQDAYDAPDSLFRFGFEGDGEGEFDSVQAVAIDSSERIYVVDGGADRIQIFDAAGRFESQIGGTFGSADGEFKRPSDVTLDGDGRVFIADTFNHRIQVFDSSGTFLFKFGTPGLDEGKLNRPGGVAVDPDGRIIVSDFGNDRVQVFDPSGEFLFAIGGLGAGDGQFDNPLGVLALADGRIMVADGRNDRIQVFDSSGAFLFAFGGLPLLRGPSAIATDASGRVYTPISGYHRVHVFDPDGNFIGHFGELGTGAGEFRSPTSIAVGNSGRIYVGEFSGERVQVFRAFEPDSDGDGLVDCGDLCPSDPENSDVDNDEVCAADDNCPEWFNPDQLPDETVPVVTPPSSLIVECASDGSTPAASPEVSDWLDSATVSDVCGATTLTHDAPEQFVVGLTEVAFTGEDESNNVGVGFSTIEVVDSVPPELSVPEPMMLECNGPGGVSESDAQIQTWLASTTASDDCGIVTTTNDAPSVLEVGSTSVSFTTVDEGGNTVADSSAVTVKDSEPPFGTIVSPVDQACSGAPVTVLDNFADICDPDLTRSYTPGTGPTYGQHGDHTITVLAQDNTGNIVGDSVEFTIDLIPPELAVDLPEDRTFVIPKDLPLKLKFSSEDEDGAVGDVILEQIALSGCAILDGDSLGDQDGFLSDEKMEFDGPALCTVFEGCGFGTLEHGQVEFIAKDCAGNVSIEHRRFWNPQLLVAVGLCRAYETDLQFESSAVLSWSGPYEPTAEFDVYRGNVPDLKNGEYGERVVEGIVANSLDVHEDPDPGQGWIYLVHMKDD